MNKLSLFMLFFLISIRIYSQNYQVYRGDTINRIDARGLKYGRWIGFNDYYDTLSVIKGNDLKFLFEENYEIIYIKDTSFLKDLQPHSQEGLYFFKNKPAFHCYKHFGNYFSVCNGYRIVYNHDKFDNSIESITNFEHGYQKSFREFKDHRLKYENKDGCIDGKSISDTYLDGDSFVFCRWLFAMSDYEYNKVIYYPTSDISISECNISFNTSFSKPDTLKVNLMSNSSQEVTIDSIISTSEQISIIDRYGSRVKSLKIKSKDTTSLFIVNSPDRYNLRYSDTIRLITKLFPHTYHIFVQRNAFDIGPSNVNKVKKIELIKIPDKKLFFYITEFGYHGLISLKDDKNILIPLNFIGQSYYKKWDISSLRQGSYNLFVENQIGDRFNLQLIIR